MWFTIVAMPGSAETGISAWRGAASHRGECALVEYEDDGILLIR